MDTAPAPRTSQAWWFHDDVAPDVQSLIGTGFGHLRFGTALLLDLTGTTGGAWIAALPVTVATEPRDGQTEATALAISARGLRRCGVPAHVLAQFAPAFREGMTQPDRARRLGDTRDEPATILHGGLLWSDAPGDAAPDAAAPAHLAVDAMLLCYAATAPGLEAAVARHHSALAPHGVGFGRRIAFTPLASGPDAPMREPFGFADGISQPFPEDAPGSDGAQTAIRRKPRTPAIDAALAHHRIRSGDILFGRKDAYGECAGGIFLREAEAAGLAQGTAPPGQRDLGWNGSYLVVRELAQDVAGFWAAMRTAAAVQGLDAQSLAEKTVGRRLNGGLLTPAGAAPGNDRGFAQEDPHGLGCPLGAHVRRANPRDSGARNAAERESRQNASNNHRILRRGRAYGVEDAAADPAGRGLYFMCLNTDITRQFEFVQQTWLMNRRFAARDQTDPLVGPRGHFSFDATPVRRRIAVETFVRLAGGGYFFLPGIRALAWLAARAPAPSPVAGEPSAPRP